MLYIYMYLYVVYLIWQDNTKYRLRCVDYPTSCATLGLTAVDKIEKIR
jgi:hypothetical protein